MRVLIQLRTTPQVRAAMAAGEAIPATATEAAALVPAGLVLDAGFDPVELPGVQLEDGDSRLLAMSAPLEFFSEGEGVTQLVRGTIPDDDLQGEVISQAIAHPGVVGLFSDPVIENNLTCIGDPPVGTSTQVGQLLDVTALTNAGMTGQGVHLAIVDTGMNVAYLRAKGSRRPRRPQALDSDRGSDAAWPARGRPRHDVRVRRAASRPRRRPSSTTPCCYRSGRGGQSWPGC